MRGPLRGARYARGRATHSPEGRHLWSDPTALMKPRLVRSEARLLSAPPT